MARLVVITQGVAASVHELGEGWTTIGRADGNTFQLVEPSISGRHCEVRLHGGELLVRDLLSTNGTFVGGKKVSEAAVKPGETLRLGDVELRFESGSAPETPGTSFISKSLMMQSAPQPKSEPVPASVGTKDVAPAPAASSGADRPFQV